MDTSTVEYGGWAAYMETHSSAMTHVPNFVYWSEEEFTSKWTAMAISRH